MGRAESETRRVQMVGVDHPAHAPAPERRWLSPATTTKAESPRSRPRPSIAARTPRAELANAAIPPLEISTLAAAQAAIESLEAADEVDAPRLTPKRRADTRAATEPHTRFANGTSTNEALEVSSNVERVSERFDVEPTEELKASQANWLGIAVTTPQVGARVVIGTRMGQEFIVTSPVVKVITQDDGVLIETSSSNRYFVAHNGDAFSCPD